MGMAASGECNFVKVPYSGNVNRLATSMCVFSGKQKHWTPPRSVLSQENMKVHRSYNSTYRGYSPSCPFIRSCIHPQSLTWNLKMMVSNRDILFQWLIFRFHVKLWEGIHEFSMILVFQIWGSRLSSGHCWYLLGGFRDFVDPPGGITFYETGWVRVTWLSKKVTTHAWDVHPKQNPMKNPRGVCSKGVLKQP